MKIKNGHRCLPLVPKFQLRHALGSEVALRRAGVSARPPSNPHCSPPPPRRVGIGARSARRRALRAKCNFAHKCGPKLELGTEEKDALRILRARCAHARFVLAFSHAAKAASLIAPAASASVRTVASTSSAAKRRPLSSRNVTATTNATRLLPSMNG